MADRMSDHDGLGGGGGGGGAHKAPDSPGPTKAQIAAARLKVKLAKKQGRGNPSDEIRRIAEYGSGDASFRAEPLTPTPTQVLGLAETQQAAAEDPHLRQMLEDFVRDPALDQVDRIRVYCSRREPDLVGLYLSDALGNDPMAQWLRGGLRSALQGRLAEALGAQPTDSKSLREWGMPGPIIMGENMVIMPTDSNTRRFKT